MIKKILLIILLLLSSCTQSKEDNLEFIDPVQDVFIFSRLNDETKNRIKKANSNKEYQNYQFATHGKEVFSESLVDINNKQINLNEYKNLAIEIVSVTCSHCKNQIHLINDFVSKFDGAFIQYFDVGSKQEVLDLYTSENVEIPDNLIIITRDDRMHDYILNDLKLQMYPTLLCFKNGRISFCTDGELTIESYENVLDIGFVNTLSEQDYFDDQGNNVLNLNRSIEDVKESLSKQNQTRINNLDNDSYTSELTYRLMGRHVDLTNVSNTSSSLYINEVKDFSEFQDSQLVLIYTSLKNENDINFINELISSNKDVEYLVLLSEGMDSSSNLLKTMSTSFNCPVASMLSSIPEDFNSFEVSNYPTAIFVNNSTFTGAYSNIESKEKFLEAIDMFLGKDCIAYKNNN